MYCFTAYIFPWGTFCSSFPLLVLWSAVLKQQFTAEIPGLSSEGNHSSLSLLTSDEGTEF